MRSVLMLVCVLSLLTQSGLRGEGPNSPDGQLRVLDGFSIERVAGPPLVDRPIVADFDLAGNLYVADSSGSNDNVKKQLEERPHRIVRLTDHDGDGRYDSRTVFADRMMFPEGTMWFGGSLYVSAPPSIWKLTDTDGDGVADQREEWLHQTLTGCANDLHGPYAGPDGWIYWCKGAFAEQTHLRRDGPPLVTRASHIFRRRPEGGDVEVVMTGGMDNPVDVVFTAEGERIFTTTFLQNPRGGLRDGLIHAIYGGVYGKQNSRIGPQKRTGKLMPVLTHLGAAAPCGLTRFRSKSFGEEYEGNLFACLFNMHKVTRHSLVPEGATFRTIDEDFVASDNVDFHPTDVVEDADGTLLIVDTGGWYKLCCPTSQLHKPDVLGAIYRVRRIGAKNVEDPRGLAFNWKQSSLETLGNLLADERVAVRSRATQELGARGAAAAAFLGNRLAVASGNSSEDVAWRRRALWALSRIESSGAREAVRRALGDGDESVRQVAAHVVSLWRDPAAVAGLVKLLESPSAHNRRVAAEALGRLGDPAAVPHLLEGAKTMNGRVLEHSLIYALIEIGDAKATRQGLGSSHSGVRKAALLALDQMDDGGLAPEEVTTLLRSHDDAVRTTALWIASHRPEWGGELVSFLRERLHSVTSEERSAVETQLASYGDSTAVQTLIAEELGDRKTDSLQRAVLLGAMKAAGLREPPMEWVTALYDALSHQDILVVEAALAAARSLRVPKEAAAGLNLRLVAAANRDDLPAVLRLEALAAAPEGVATVGAELYGLLIKHLRMENPIAVRGTSAAALANATLSVSQLHELARTLPETGALEVNRLLVAFEQAPDPALGKKVFQPWKIPRPEQAYGSIC
jgi:putative membrane-bound dehydrogenase-like protein